MKNNFDCCYISVSGTFCFHYDKEIVDDLNNNECINCYMNNSCLYCQWGLSGSQVSYCVDCSLKDLENE